MPEKMKTSVTGAIVQYNKNQSIKKKKKNFLTDLAMFTPNSVLRPFINELEQITLVPITFSFFPQSQTFKIVKKIVK